MKDNEIFVQAYKKRKSFKKSICLLKKHNVVDKVIFIYSLDSSATTSKDIYLQIKQFETKWFLFINDSFEYNDIQNALNTAVNETNKIKELKKQNSQINFVECSYSY